MTEPLRHRRVALGVSGSIAAYKALTLASGLAQAQAEVDVLLTPAAARLVTPLSFQALTHRPVVADLWEPAGPMAMDHLTVAHAAEALVIFPATADLLARLSLGLAGDAVTTTALATQAPLLVAPAMEPQMWRHPATQWHAETLAARGVTILGPEEGRLASGAQGPGRLIEPDTILEHLRLLFARHGPLAGRTVLVTAGPTREPLDPVRYLSNQSSGRMGDAVAREARDRGARVILVSGPTALPAPVGVEVVAADTAAQMAGAVLERAAGADAVIMAAAVADYRPAEVSAGKLKKGPPGEVMSLALARTPDILVELDRALANRDDRPVRVGFAAETDDLVANARAKLQAKGLDLVVANPVPETFGSEHGQVTLVDAAGATPLGRLSKREVAQAILDRVATLLDHSRPA
jgi:phosphopantothenoylcysteine decarboxylase/phosphopantothenate--cysteine ligase